MGARDLGLSRIATVTTALAVAGIAGSVVVAVVAHADSGTTTTGPAVTNSVGQPHASSGGS